MKRGIGIKKTINQPKKQISLTVIPPKDSQSDIIQVEFRHQPAAKKRRRQRRFTLLFLAVMLLMLMPMIRDVLTYYKLNQQYQILQNENVALLDIKSELQTELLALDNPEIIEKMARENLGLVMPGESKIYQAIPTKNIPKQEKLQSGEVLH